MARDRTKELEKLIKEKFGLIGAISLGKLQKKKVKNFLKALKA